MRIVSVAVLFAGLLLLGSAARAEARGSLGVNAGIATGDNGIGLGWIVGGNYTLGKKLGPVQLRADATYQDYGDDLSIFGLAGNAIFPISRIYALGGIGWYDSSPGDSNVDVTLGLGWRRAGGFYFEGRWLEIDGFTTFPVVLGFSF